MCDCIENNWKKYYYGRCLGCGNGFNKDLWKGEYALFIDNYLESLWDDVIFFYNNEGFNHEGNGVCFSCASEYIEFIELNKILCIKCDIVLTEDDKNHNIDKCESCVDIEEELKNNKK